MSLKQQIEASNHELVNKDGVLIDLTQHLALNKLIFPITQNPYGKEIGFFKDMDGQLQIHLCITTKEGIVEWHRFGVIDADDEQIARNKKLNIRRGRMHSYSSMQTTD